MSLDATIWAWKQQEIKPLEKLVLLSLADRADELNTCYPSIKRLCLDTGMAKSSVIKCLQSLEESSLLLKLSVKRINNGFSNNVYQLVGVNNREGLIQQEYEAMPEGCKLVLLNGSKRPVMVSTPSTPDGQGASTPDGQALVRHAVTNLTKQPTKEITYKEEIGNFPRSPLAGDCSQTSNKFDADTNIDAKPQRENENDTSEYLKAKSAKQKAAPKPKAKPAARAKFANQVDRDDYPCTKAALYAIERHVAQSGGKHNFWVDANTSRPVIQLAHIEQVERNLTDLAEYFDTMPGTIPEIAASLMMEMYEVRGAKHKVKGKKTPVDLAFLACIGLKDPHTGCDFEGQDLCGWFANSSGT